MTNFEILKVLADTKNDLRSQEIFLEKIRFLSGKFGRMTDMLFEIAAFNREQPNHLNTLQTELNAIREYMREFSSRMFFENTLTITGILKSLLISIPSAERITTRLLEQLNSLQDAYDGYLRKHAMEDLIPVLEHADMFILYLHQFYDYVEMTNGMLASDEPIPNNAGTFELYMPAMLTFEDFIARLKAIKEIYDELCLLLNVSTSDQPLRIAKIESGSLWASLFGNSKVIALMNDFIRGGASYLKRNYTTEGKLEAIPSTVKVMDDALGYTLKLKEAGLDVSDAEAELAKGAHVLAKNITALLARQSSVVVSGEMITLVEGTDQRSLEYRSRLRLENDGSKNQLQ
jgi:hypothetical protein